jgi:hypothetical protein
MLRGKTKGHLERMKRGSGIDDRDDRSSDIHYPEQILHGDRSRI